MRSCAFAFEKFAFVHVLVLSGPSQPGSGPSQRQLCKSFGKNTSEGDLIEENQTNNCNPARRSKGIAKYSLK